MIDPPPGGTASEAEAAHFPRLARHSPAALVAGAAIIAILVLAYLVGEALAIFLVGLILAIMFLEGQVLVPPIEGKQFEIHAAWVLVLILVGLALVGPLGAILALPVAAAARDAYPYIFRRAAGREPNPSFEAAPTFTPGDSPDPHRHHEETVASAAAGGTS